MLFTSPFFLFVFLPMVLLFYVIAPKKTKNGFLLAVSLFFYTWGEKELVLLLITSAIIDYSCGLIINYGKKKLGLCISIIFNVSILIYFKYSNFVFSNLVELLESFNLSTINANYFSTIALPLGISFYTFQTMSYTIDVYRGHVKANKNFIEFATYVSLFPQLVAGPIVRYSEIKHELKNRKITIPLFYEGIERFIIGLSKKMIIANHCAFLADGMFALNNGELSTLSAWLGVIAYSLQIYFDFSGYSDMAIGLGKMLGFNFPENFNLPYISKSIREFWRRWHITLSNWFRDYVYISLGGNRSGNFRTYINLVIVFSITGLWHGANWTFLIWGLWHGSFIIFERLGLKSALLKLPSFFSHLYVIFVTMIAWVFFRSDTIIDAFAYIKALFNSSISTNFEHLNFYLTKEVIIALVLGILFSVPITDFIKKYLKTLFSNNTSVLLTLKSISLLFLFTLDYLYIVTGSYNPFIYFRF